MRVCTLLDPCAELATPFRKPGLHRGPPVAVALDFRLEPVACLPCGAPTKTVRAWKGASSERCRAGDGDSTQRPDTSSRGESGAWGSGKFPKPRALTSSSEAHPCFDPRGT